MLVFFAGYGKGRAEGSDGDLGVVVQVMHGGEGVEANSYKGGVEEVNRS